LLGPYVDIALETGDVDGARVASDELRAIAAELGSAMLAAEAARSAGAVLLAAGGAPDALPELRRAFLAFRDLGAVHDAARTRLLMAEACNALGDHESAESEREVAQRAFAGFREAVGEAAALPDGLTAREVDVLRLLARGKTNRVIGEELFISEKTVASHVSHIFTKLGVGSRAAATAYAYDNGLV
jgi:DNA-binding CsgD family transcriptional regulator